MRPEARLADAQCAGAQVQSHRDRLLLPRCPAGTWDASPFPASPPSSARASRCPIPPALVAPGTARASVCLLPGTSGHLFPSPGPLSPSVKWESCRLERTGFEGQAAFVSGPPNSLGPRGGPHGGARQPGQPPAFRRALCCCVLLPPQALQRVWSPEGRLPVGLPVPFSSSPAPGLCGPRPCQPTPPPAQAQESRDTRNFSQRSRG